MTLLTALLILSFAMPTLADTFASHPPLRPLPKPSNQPMADGPAYFVDPAKGDDASDGSKDKPWRTINHALLQLKAGDTLYLRGGSYFENVYCAVAGTKDKPITIRSYPGELATIDGSIPEFQLDPAGAWQVVDEALGEYRSTRAYRNIRDVVGRFGDSNVGLQTYWYTMDLRAENEKWIPNEETFIEPIYCGPGLWYDKQTGHIHVRLAHTKLELPETSKHEIVHYRGETDPRKLPLAIAPFNSVPLRVDQAMHVRFEDLAIRGAGYNAVVLNFGVDITFDRCTIYAGTYGVWAKGTGPLEMVNTGVYGMIAPWMFRNENCLYAYSSVSYPPFTGDEALPDYAGAERRGEKRRVIRHISRLPTHALLVTEGAFEFETFHHPYNHHWNVHHCEFTDGHDGVYPAGREIHFHHNLVDNMQDDALYFSSPTPYYSDRVFVYQNLIRQCIIGFGGHARGGPGGKIYLFRNIVDMRKRLQFSRPTPKHPEGNTHPGAIAFSVHGADGILHMEDVYLYQNTTLARGWGMVGNFHPDAERRVFNNLHVYYGGGKRYPNLFPGKRDRANLVMDGNLHWVPTPDAETPDPAEFFKHTRNHPLSEANKEHYPDGWDAHSVVGDPKFINFQMDPASPSDLRLQPDSPAKGAGVVLPEDWPDPLRPADGSRPDIGALPVGAEPLRVGIDGRAIAGE